MTDDKFLFEGYTRDGEKKKKEERKRKKKWKKRPRMVRESPATRKPPTVPYTMYSEGDACS